MIERWKPEFYIKGGDYKAGALRSSTSVEEYGGQTVMIPMEFDTSTTRIFEYIQALEKHAVPDQTRNPPPAGLVILDRDGTLVRDGIFDPTRIELIDGVLEGLLLLQNAGFRLCMASNQQGIGLGYFGYRDFIDGNRVLLRQLGGAGITIAKIYFCPHSFADICNCREARARNADPRHARFRRSRRRENVHGWRQQRRCRSGTRGRLYAVPSRFIRFDPRRRSGNNAMRNLGQMNEFM